MLSIQKKPHSVVFHKIESGKESQVFAKLAEEFPKDSFYKCLGGYDLVQFAGHDDESHTTLPLGVFNSRAITAIGWNGDIETPNLKEWFGDFSLAAFVFITINKWHYNFASPSEIIVNIINTIISSPKSLDIARNTCFLGGTGKSQLYGVVRGNSFDELFQFASVLRSQKLGDIFDDIPEAFKDIAVCDVTQTLPLVSYENVISHNTFSKIKGFLSPKVFIKCSPGLESNIAETFGGDGAICESSLGQFDLIAEYPSRVKAKNFVSSLMKFREGGAKSHPGSVDTITYISTNHFPDVSVSVYEMLPKIPIASIQSAFIEQEPHRARRIKYFIENHQSDSRIRDKKKAIEDMMFFPGRLAGEVNDYLRTGSDGEGVQRLGAIDSMLESAEIGISQRLGGIRIDLHEDRELGHLAHSDGMLLSIKAADYLMRYIYGVWGDTEEAIWPGFVFFSDNFHFQLRDGTVFSLPTEAVVSPLGQCITWLSLTHEMSHAIWIHEGIIDFASNIVQGSAKQASPASVSDYQRAERQSRNQYWELFANWYDYCHFFNEEHEEYQQYIWETWGVLPYVLDNPYQYLLRSFIIFLLRKESDYQEAKKSGADIHYARQHWQSFVQMMQEVAPEFCEIINVEDRREGVLELFHLTGPRFLGFVDKHYDMEFQSRINRPYENLEKHIALILDGTPITDAIDNPLLLLKECRRRLVNEGVKTSFKQNLAYIWSLSNQEEFSFGYES